MITKYCAMGDEQLCDFCKTPMKLQMPNILGQEVRETVDAMTGSKWIQDQQEIIKERKADYFWSIEVPRMVNSGTYSIETMFENGWVYYNEKGDLVTRTKPPQKG
jgi:hypothetical protein